MAKGNGPFTRRPAICPASGTQVRTIDIVLYNIPQFSNEISLPVVTRLALDCPRIVGTKDSNRDFPRFLNTLHAIKPPNWHGKATDNIRNPKNRISLLQSQEINRPDHTGPESREISGFFPVIFDFKQFSN